MKTKSIILILISVFLTQMLSAQIDNAVTWTHSYNKTGVNEYELVFKGKIIPHTHLYSAQSAPEDPMVIGPQSPYIELDNKSGVELVGDLIEEGTAIKAYDPIFELDVVYYENEVTLKQKVKLTADVEEVLGYFQAQLCDDQACVYPSEEFSFHLPYEEPAATGFNSSEIVPGNEPETSEPVNVAWTINLIEKDGKTAIEAKAKIPEEWHLYSSNIPANGPLPTRFHLDTENAVLQGDIVENGEKQTEFDSVFEVMVDFYENEATFTQTVQLPKGVTEVQGYVDYMICNESSCMKHTEDFELSTEETSIAAAEEDKSTPWGIFIAGFLGGLLALLMPCLYPMIPLTVSFFTKQASSRSKGIRQALTYGLSIIVIFVAFSLIISMAFGADAIYKMSTGGVFNMLFFILFVVFAISFFGAFEITLPASWINKADKQADRGGLIGVFFMAFTLVLVSFSCTGPIIGTLLVEAASTGDKLGPFMGFLGFSIALAIPYTMFAIFPSWLNSLPQSGGWLNTVKVVLGFLELALAMKFLSNVDLAYHWGFLKREIFLSIWITIFALTGFYLLGKFKFKHDSEVTHLSITRVMFAMLFFSFTVYLVPGLWGAPVKITTGLLPPTHYKEWVQEQPAVRVTDNGQSQDAAIAAADGDAHCPHGLNCFHDYDKGMAYAKMVGKPVMLDFTGWTCVNCRKMEDYVWVVPNIYDLINNEYVLISLYVDDRTKLPKDEQYQSDASGKMKKIRTVGDKWLDMEVSKYARASQPWYVLLDHEENQLAEPLGFTDADSYYNFLKSGLDKFKQAQ